MGKNRKLKNGVDQVQNCCFIETENTFQEIPEDFLTSDDFCVVQKKKGLRKVGEYQESKKLYRSLSDSGKHFENEDSAKCHTSFWTCKFNGSASSSSVTTISDDFTPQCSSDELQVCSDDLKFSKDNLELKSDPLNLNFDPLVEDAEHLSFGTKPKTTTIEVEAVEIESSVDECVSPDVVCCTRKKNRKKEQKNKLVDEEIEKLLKQLDIDEKSAVIPNTDSIIFYSDANNNKNSHLKKCEIQAESINSDIINFKEVIGDKGQSTKALCDTESKNSALASEHTFNDRNNVLQPVAKNQEKKASKKREKTDKAKQKCTENGSTVNSDSSKIIRNVSPSTQETLASGFVSNCSNEKKLASKAGEPERKGKKRLSKKQLSMIHEALRKAKEEEEKLRKEAEMRQKKIEEAERIRQEKLREEQEKKEKKKLKEKQRREKMRAEGRLLSKSQKQSRARMVATLAAFRQQGIDVPQISDKRPSGSHGPRLGNSKYFQRRRNDSCQSAQSSDSAIVSERQKSESFSSQESSGKDSLSDLPSSFDSAVDLPFISGSEKVTFSCSEESDGLDDGINCDLQNCEKLKESKVFEDSEGIKREVKCDSQAKVVNSNHNANAVKFRSPVVCVLGHVDTGKTKLLDYIRKTHIQDSEAGGITQQIGATMIPQDALKEKCKMVKGFSSVEIQIPGLLVIDTPGHESFSNLRSRGSSICDIAILVVDIMHGLEPQTIESLNLLKKRKIPFIVALNKVDRIYGWKSANTEDIETVIKNQSLSTQSQFKKRCQEIILQFANECLNATLFYENKNPRSYVSMVPTSAISGDGMGNLLSTVALLTQTLMHKKLIFSDELEATVLEVKAIPGLGTTIDVILVNGRLHEGDTIVLAGQEGPFVTQIRSLLMPQPLKELRVKNPYIEYKVIEGAQGVKITGRDFDKSIAGLPLLVAPNHGMLDTLKEEMNGFLRDAISSIKTSERGVYVQASTLGSLEALLDFLSASGIPYFQVKIGPVVKKDVMRASIMLEHDSMYAAILAFDVKIERDAQELADSLGVHIFHANIIYHLFDMYIKYRDDLLLKRSDDIKRLAVFPCKLRILPEFVFNPRDPIILGVFVEQGTLKEGTPVCVPSRGEVLEVGIVSSIEMNNKRIDCAKKSDEVCIKIDPKPGEAPKVYGKHFDHEDLLVSRITRQSIDICKEHFRNDLQPNDWHLIVELKKMLHIV